MAGSERDSSGGLRDAAVLLPVFRDADGDLRIVIVVRADDGGRHGGQLGLPGGRPEPGDADMLETALREAEEEVGLAVDAVEILAALPSFDTMTTGWRVHPFLGRIAPDTTWRLQETEIVGLLTPSARALADPAARATLPFTSRRFREPLLVEGIDVEGHVLWGMTLRLLDATIPRLLAGEWDV